MELTAGLKFSELGRKRVVRAQMLFVLGFGVTDLLRSFTNLYLPTVGDEWVRDNYWKLDLAKTCAVIWDCNVWLIAVSIHRRLLDWSANRQEDESDLAVEVRHELVLQTA